MSDHEWCRVVVHERIDAHLKMLGPERLEAIEVNGAAHESLPWKSYTRVQYPALDALASRSDVGPCDVVICGDVLGHVADPWAAAHTLHDLCRPGGRAVISVPFLLGVDKSSDDYWRFTEDGLHRLLEDAGFTVDETGGWGSRSAIVGNFRRRPPMRPWRSLRNEPEFPLVVWAFAHRPLP